MKGDGTRSWSRQQDPLGRLRSTVGIDSYRDDPLYPRIVGAVAVLLGRGTSVAPVDVLVEMGVLEAKRLEDWRFGRVPYLERVIQGNLTRLSRLLRILRFHAHDLNLVPSVTLYMRWGKGPKQRLRFTKTGDQKVEEAYSRHFVWPGKGSFRPPTGGDNRYPVAARRAARTKSRRASRGLQGLSPAPAGIQPSTPRTVEPPGRPALSFRALFRLVLVTSVAYKSKYTETLSAPTRTQLSKIFG